MLRPVLAALVATLPFVATASAQTADIVLFNGKVVTVDKDFSIREAIAISGGRVLATGNSAAMKGLAGDHAHTIDLGGRIGIASQGSRRAKKGDSPASESGLLRASAIHRAGKIALQSLWANSVRDASCRKSTATE